MHVELVRVELVRDIAGRSVGAVIHLASAVPETQSALKARMETVSEKIDKLNRGEPGTPDANASASYTAATILRRHHLCGRKKKRKRMGPQTPHQPAKQQRDTSPVPTLMRSVRADVKSDPAQPHQLRPRGPHLAMVRRMRDGKS